MSFTQKEIIQLLLSRTDESSREIKELKHINSLFKENERSKKAKEVAFRSDFQDLRSQFSKAFIQQHGKEITV